MAFKRDKRLDQVLRELAKRKQLVPLSEEGRRAKLYEAEFLASIRRERELEIIEAKRTDTRQQYEVFMRRFNQNVQEINEQVKDLNADEKGILFKKLFEDKGMGYNPETREVKMGKITFKLGDSALGLDPSQFFKNLGWLPTYQKLQLLIKGFPFQNFFPMKMVEHGTALYFYEDYQESDTLPAYEVPEGAEYVNKLYNPPTSIMYEEQWRVYLDRHKGVKIPSSMLNDFTSKEEIFLSLVADISYQIARPIARAFAQFQMMMLQNPLNLAEGQDWDTLTPDLTITYDSGEDMISQFASWVEDQQVASRDYQPEKWRVQGADKGLEIGMNADDYELIMDNKLMNYTNMFVKAPLFNQNNLAWGIKTRSVSFKKSFESYIGANTHQDQSKTTGTFYGIVASPKSANIITMYEGTRAQDLLVFFRVEHMYIRYGDAWNKNYPIFLVKFVSSSGKLPLPSEKNSLKTINSESLVGEGNIEVQRPLSSKAGETTLTGDVVALDPAIKTTINNADTLSKKNKTEIGIIGNLDPAKTNLVDAVNGKTDKPAK